jgi:hypothetical protein
MAIWKAVGFLVLLVPPRAAGEHQKLKPTQPKVSVHVSFSIEEYEPSKTSKAIMKCVVQNDSYMSIHVPIGFDGGYIRIQSGGLTLGKNKKAKEDVKLEWVEPGHQQVVFELSLDEILLVAAERNDIWHWHWQRRPEPPRSPIHKYREPGFVDQASFTVSLDLGSYTLTSENAVLKVNSGEVLERKK